MDAENCFEEEKLIDLLFHRADIKVFEKLWEQYNDAEKWGYLLHMCYCEYSYECVGGDYGDEENPPIDVEYLKYLEDLIEFLHSLGVQEVTK